MEHNNDNQNIPAIFLDSRAEDPISNSKSPPQPDTRPSLINLFRYADKYDSIILALGVIAAVANGAPQPLMAILIGNVIGTFNAYDTMKGTDPSSAAILLDTEVKEHALHYLLLAIFSFVAAYLQMSFWMISGERQSTVSSILFL